VRIDANGDASFEDDAPLADINERFEPRALTLLHPRKASVNFVMARGRDPHVVHIYLGTSGHQSMTVSVAAGSRTDQSLAFGVAPNARVLLVRVLSSNITLSGTFEGFLEAAQRPDVDVIGSALGLSPVPDTARDFAGAFFSRLVAVYQKPIINSAGNTGLLFASVHHVGHALSAGGILAPATWAALYGGRPLGAVVVSPISAGGPSLDGAIKPDFLAPMERLAAGVPWDTTLDAVPRDAPTRRIPPGYEVSCCTSSTSPYAAGVAALLISGARQSRVPYAADRLHRAMRVSAREVPGVPAHLQGNGALDINAAWLALAGSDDPPRITAAARIVHPLAQYAARGGEGFGIVEFEGWTAGMTGTRTIVLRRHTGPTQPLAYPLEWSADDGTFSTAPSVTLPLHVDVPLPVRVAVRSPGAHSGLLTLRNPATATVAFRTQATVVAAEPFDEKTGLFRVSGTVGLMRQRVHYVNVPAGVSAIAFALQVSRGVVRPRIVAAHGLHSGYYAHVHPSSITSLGKGTYHVVLPNPEPGTWTFGVNNDSAWAAPPGDAGPADVVDADYSLTIRLLRSSMSATTAAGGRIVTELTNTGGAIVEPLLEASPAYLAAHRGRFLESGLPNVIEIVVPRDAATLALRLRTDGVERGGTNAELYLYDCTAGECFSYDFGFPAARAHTLVVRKPNAGRWMAAVNAAPYPAAAGSFVLDELVTTGPPVRRTSAVARGPGARWRETFENVSLPVLVQGKTPVLLIELLDASLERSGTEHPWVRLPRTQLRDRPVAIGTTIYRHP
jgi:hypothetical protein